MSNNNSNNDNIKSGYVNNYISDISGGRVKSYDEVGMNGFIKLLRFSFGRTKTIEMIRNEMPNDDDMVEDDGINISASLSRVLSIYDLLTYGVGSTVGAGVFVITGVVAAETAGPSMMLSFLFAAISCIFSGLCYCEFATSVPVAGSAYTYAYATMGELIGFLIGWNLTLEYGIAGSAVARGWASYTAAAVESLGGSLPKWLTNIDIGFSSLSILSVVILVICTILTVYGVKASARVNVFITTVNICIIFFIVIVGSLYIDVDNWQPFFPYGFSGAIRGASRVFFAFIGFDTVSSLAEEVKDPQKNLPRGIVGTLGISAVLYMAISLVITGMIKYTHISKESPLSDAFSSNGLGWAASLVAIGSVTTLSATTLCSLIGQPRIFLRMASDGLFFSKFAEIHPQYHSPYFGTIFTGILSSLLALFLDIDALADMISSGTLLAFDVVCVGVLVLHYKDPDTNYVSKRAKYSIFIILFGAFCSGIMYMSNVPIYAYLPILICLSGAGVFQLHFLEQSKSLSSVFVCPLVPYVPTCGILVNTLLFFQLEASAMIRLFIWTMIGLLLYLFYGIRHSNMIHANASGGPAYSGLR